MRHSILLDAIEGKTIKRVFGEFSDSMLLVFDDKTFCIIYGYESDDEVTLENGDFNLRDWDKHASELLDLGVITERDYSDHQTKQAKKEESLKEERRKKYEEMKAEFESA